MARAIGDEEPVKGRPADRLEPEFESLKKDMPESADHAWKTSSRSPSSRRSPGIFSRRANGANCNQSRLRSHETKGPAVATDLHLAPAEFNITVHGENYHVVVSGSGRNTDGRKPYYIRVNDRLQEVSLEPLQEVLAGVPESPDSRQHDANRNGPGRPNPAMSPHPCPVAS